MKKINIAIDGYAGCGKSTTAKQVAQRLGYVFIDTGAMYRAVALHFLREGIDYQIENAEMQQALQQVKIDFKPAPAGQFPLIQLNGTVVEAEIRRPEISAIVSPVSVHKSVRDTLVAQQQRMGKNKGVVMDGRDTGTVVFPDAELKVFMTAPIEVRARRRLFELESKGVETTLDEVIQNLTERDHIDSSRKVGPLRKAADAIVIDTGELNIGEQIDLVYNLAIERIHS